MPCLETRRHGIEWLPLGCESDGARYDHATRNTLKHIESLRRLWAGGSLYSIPKKADPLSFLTVISHCGLFPQ